MYYLINYSLYCFSIAVMFLDETLICGWNIDETS